MTYIYANSRIVGATSKFIGIPSPMHARAIFSASECKAMGIERNTMIYCKPSESSLPAEPVSNGLTFDGEASFS